VIAIHNFGAGDIIEIAPPQGTTMLLRSPTQSCQPSTSRTGAW